MIKLCVDCKFHQEIEYGRWIAEKHYCLKHQKEHVNLITGEHFTSGSRPCVEERYDESKGHCGSAGHFWKPKEVEDANSV